MNMYPHMLSDFSWETGDLDFSAKSNFKYEQVI